ncbi:uncharacterized protein LOC116917499 isoform X1 [Daphnia magna]|uniref:uncharacterized protein LOC116917499 isoform X1 n=1 Tax=Daphnia magna TaxID=35525 RepID=UPI001E1BCC4B|nr:uncharacterized protein LOC116917499 isoform X1 [Daphnia magna]XP_032778877.2 uncharacterized protein LOC116917499 isoform X1 [Daphnia magna]XP_032778878.2 uncharacterized protein LOC116917499 isoform X1 [Daphnia magna]XP_032778879.2 uncharacterized protein LOC116917499 isoform X1 [Daphnia magna]XP_032778880.2 uncharacterized protein LOC116917499 isoform X1 [Daphnia magna]XP_045024982.1 uncharacterized protein LOC116917499 isoform X1 [Daphnia magna]
MVGSVSRLTTAVHSLGIRAITSGSNIGRGTVGNFGVGSVSVGVKLLGQLMGWGENSSDLQSNCQANCSHGECYNGTCFCEIQFEGVQCAEPSVGYHVGFASVFLLVAATSLIQLFICIHAEYARLKTPSFLKACRITNQKFLYILVFLAALLRGLYFAYPATTDEWSSSLLSAYYPVLLTGASLIVCFWAEVFHLRDVEERPPFLSKSFLGFLAFNVITYSLLIAELVITNTQIHSEEDKRFFTNVFNGCYAILMFIVVIFFLIYGVEVYFKVRGGFLHEGESSIPLGIMSFKTITSSSSPACLSSFVIASSPDHAGHVTDKDAEEKEVTVHLMKEEVIHGRTPVPFRQSIDTAQLHQSRLGLVSQAMMLLITVCFLLSEILGEFWKKKVPLESRNIFDVVFRLVELGVALWFPCVLWNCMRPDQLWILNPKKILKKFDIATSLELTTRNAEDAPPKTQDTNGDRKAECWICYDTDTTDAGLMIFPCSCKGDVGAVHHECLKRWLIESANNPSALICKVCQTPYQVETKARSWSQINVAITPWHWAQTAGLVLLMCGSVGGACAIIKIYEDSGIRLLAVSVALLIVYICCRFLGLNTIMAYQRAKVSAFKIVSTRTGPPASEMEEFATVQDLSVDGRTQVDVFATSRSAQPTLEM